MIHPPPPISDESQRNLALDPSQSFIVQAPAGSGKTELLTQRFLILLAHAKKSPEEILAITFTRKAAAEMRTRIIQALERAAQSPQPDAPHARKTWQLAHAVLQRNVHDNWQLLENPNRLRIQTIDSLSANLVHQMPMLSGLGSVPEIANDPARLYQQAVKNTFSSLDDHPLWSQLSAHLLTHLDNRYEYIETLLITMLEQREQWLTLLPHAEYPELLREHLEQGLQNEITYVLSMAVHHIPAASIEDLLSLARHAAQTLIAESSDSPIIHCAQLTTLAHTHLQDRIVWEGLATLLLTKDYQWRKTVNQQQGFFAPSSEKDKTKKAVLSEKKQQMLALLTTLETADTFRLALQKIMELPPAQYTDSQWLTVHSLLTLLKIAAAQLKLVFAAEGCVDYTEIALSALTALGSPEQPTELALTLDTQIQHILVDEFQDTSVSQYRLIEQLTAGWTPHDGRTLFLVGDPMQSIYRFRKAEVGLFLRARTHGIGMLRLTPLQLHVNFRSTQTIMDWINTVFKTIFPKSDQLHAGAVCYTPSIAIPSTEQDSAVLIHRTSDKLSEAEKIAEIVRETLTKKQDAHIAILVRSRSHLNAILPTLNLANIPYRAVDIASLKKTPVIQDLLALTRALLHPGDRIAWLAILRAPWCGLTLQDLHLIARPELFSTTTVHTIWDALVQCHQQLSQDGQYRATRIIPILTQALQQITLFPLPIAMKRTWLALGGPACVEDTAALQHAELFFNLLQDMTQNQGMFDLNAFTLQLETLYAPANTNPDIRVDIMTLHKAKGLEFDVVILPGLGRASAKDNTRLLLTLERTDETNTRHLLLAPIKSTDTDVDPIYRYLQRAHAEKSLYETTRLLYVGATRAKHTLHLLGQSTASTPISGSLLAHLWPAISRDFSALSPLTSPLSEPSTDATTPLLRRLSSHWHPPEDIIHADTTHT